MSGAAVYEKYEAHLFLDARHQLAEGPLWFDERWWWVDIEVGSLHSCDGAGTDLWSRGFGQRLGAVGPMTGDRFLLALQQGLAVWDRNSDVLEFVASPDEGLVDNRCNDGKWDPVGRFIVGTLNMQGSAGTAALYSFEFPKRLTKRVSGLSVANGLAWTPDGHTFYHVDSLHREITAYDYDLETGAMTSARVVVKVPAEFGYADGMDIDENGNLWVAHWDGGAVRCWSPKSGTCLAEIAVPCARPTSCCFGGPNGDQLLITTARIGLSEEELERTPLSGSLFIAQPFAPRRG